jgi:predicted ester cyclase
MNITQTFGTAWSWIQLLQTGFAQPATYPLAAEPAVRSFCLYPSMKQSDQTEINKAIVRRFYEEVFNQRNFDAIDQLLDDAYINHDPTSLAASDRASMKQFSRRMAVAFPNHQYQIEDMVAEGDKVVVRCTLTARPNGYFPGCLEMRLQDTSICQRQIHILRLQGGKLIEHWMLRDDLSMMQQLDIIPVLSCSSN